MKCIVLANGQAPSKKILMYLNNKGYKTLICADGGANSVFKLDIIPDYIIGDLDSILPGVYDYYFDRCKIIKKPDQSSTDVEKCLEYAVKKKFTEVILLGATGDRLDHSFCNLGIVIKYFNKICVKILHHSSLLCAYKKNVTLKTIPNEVISIYGFDAGTKIKSYGLKYPLKNISLHFGRKESTSNVALCDEVKLSIKNGIVFVIRDFDIMKKYDLF